MKMKSRWATVVTLLGFFMCVQPTAVTAQASDPDCWDNDCYGSDDSISTASTITVNTEIQNHNFHWIDPTVGMDEDFVQFYAIKDRALQIETDLPTGSWAITYFEVYDGEEFSLEYVTMAPTIPKSLLCVCKPLFSTYRHILREILIQALLRYLSILFFSGGD